MRLPRLSEIPPGVSHRDVGRVAEALLAGLRSNPPDTFLDDDDWQETIDEAERLLDEVEAETRGG
jgi:hypothetical protein